MAPQYTLDFSSFQTIDFDGTVLRCSCKQRGEWGEGETVDILVVGFAGVECSRDIRRGRKEF